MDTTRLECYFSPEGSLSKSKVVLLRSRIAFLATVFLVSMLDADQANANRWDFTPSLAADLAYSDNVDLTNTNEKDDWVLQIRPALEFSKRAGRIDVGGRYSLQRAQYLNETDNNDTYHQLRSGLKAELVRNNLFFNASANARQSLVDFGRPGSSDNISGSDNRATVIDYELEPVYKANFANKANFTAKYRYSSVLYDGNSGRGSDSSQYGYTLTLNSDNNSRDYFWVLTTREETTDYDSDNDTKVTDSWARVGYFLTRRLNVNGTYGYEKQNNDQDNLRDDPDGSYWSVGFRWEPSDTSSVSASMGERYYGDSYSLDISQRHRRNTFTLGYSDLQTSTRDQFISSPNGFICPEGTDLSGCRPVDDALPIGLQIGVGEVLVGDNAIDTGINDQVFVSKTWRFGYAYAYQKSRVNITGFHQKREYQTVLGEEKSTGGTTSYTLTHNPRLSSSFSYGHTKDQLFDGEEYRTNRFSYRVVRNLDPDTDANFRVSHSRRTGDISTSEYKEIRFVVGVLRNF
ncbi:TIGR03016 family PEP-CTERM system-associated outer membrane protein [Aestuariirhabdus sp. LZHN29]|uniref:TIGR03016 family PEP-CTERM system-associated outer membrane protein n=1 Tax=Aestuariirhabdus sp. LZHN29 TaxID=3417462 RepID=UPI003CE8FB6D